MTFYFTTPEKTGSRENKQYLFHVSYTITNILNISFLLIIYPFSPLLNNPRSPSLCTSFKK